MLKVNRKVLLLCCLIIITAILFCKRNENFGQELPGMSVTPLPLPGMSATPSPLAGLGGDVVKYEIGAVSKFGDTVVLLREDNENCEEPKITTRNVKDVMRTSAGLRKDLNRMGDIMTQNFRDDPEKLTNLFLELENQRSLFNSKVDKEYAQYIDDMAVDFSISSDNMLVSHASNNCTVEAPLFVHSKISKISGNKLDHGSFVLAEVPTSSSELTPVRVSENTNFLWVKIGAAKYALTIITSRDSKRNTTHDIDYTLIPQDDESNMAAPPNSLRVWDNLETLDSYVKKENTLYPEYFQDTIYRIQRRISTLTGTVVKTNKQQMNAMMSVTLPPLPDNVTERDLYMKKINAEVAGAVERALGATEEAKNIVNLHDEATRIALDALSAKTQSENKVVQKKGELDDLQKRYKATQSDVGVKNRAKNRLLTQLGKLNVLIEQNTERAKMMTERAKKALSVDTVRSDVSLSSKQLQKESGNIMSDVIDFKTERSQLKEQENGISSEISSLETELKNIEVRMQNVAEELTSLTLTNNSRTNTMNKTANVVANLRKKIEPAKKAEEQMKIIAKQVEQEAITKIADYEKRIRERENREKELKDKQYLADQAAEARARQERLAYEAKLRVEAQEKSGRMDKATRQLLAKTSKQLDQQRESAMRLEEEVDTLVKALDESGKESFYQQNACPRKAQFLKYYL